MTAPKLNLKATLIPRSVVRATVLADTMASFGIPADIIDIAQRGYLSGDLVGIRISGYDTEQLIQDEVKLWFDELARDDDVAIDQSDPRSMIEKVGTKFAHAVSFSVNRMRRRGLGIQYYFLHAPGRDAHMVNARFGLTGNSGLRYADGHAPRLLFNVRPGSDPGIHFCHYTAWRVR